MTDAGKEDEDGSLSALFRQLGFTDVIKAWHDKETRGNAFKQNRPRR